MTWIKTVSPAEDEDVRRAAESNGRSIRSNMRLELIRLPKAYGENR